LHWRAQGGDREIPQRGAHSCDQGHTSDRRGGSSSSDLQYRRNRGKRRARGDGVYPQAHAADCAQCKRTERTSPARSGACDCARATVQARTHYLSAQHKKEARKAPAGTKDAQGDGTHLHGRTYPPARSRACHCTRIPSNPHPRRRTSSPHPHRRTSSPHARDEQAAKSRPARSACRRKRCASSSHHISSCPRRAHAIPAAQHRKDAQGTPAQS
jgi:hypothetical protein